VKDTSPQAQARYFELLGKQTPEQRFASARRLTTMVRELALAGIRHASPGSSEGEVRVELARRLYGEAVARRLGPRLLHG
jgi:two-component sensor histidine kinase